MVMMMVVMVPVMAVTVMPMMAGVPTMMAVTMVMVVMMLARQMPVDCGVSRTHQNAIRSGGRYGIGRGQRHQADGDDEGTNEGVHIGCRRMGQNEGFKIAENAYFVRA